jgi:predicted hydrocarbon binding protein
VLTSNESASEALGKFVVDPDNGWIMARDERVIVFRVKTFQAMMDRLTSVAGSTVTKTLFYMMGEEIGQTAMRYSKNEIHGKGDLTRIADRLLAIHGWGRCLSFETTDRDGQTVYVCVVKGTPLSHQRVTNEPTCHVMRGVVAGWLEVFLDKKAQSSTETQCASMGSQQCVFEVTFEP